MFGKKKHTESEGDATALQDGAVTPQRSAQSFTARRDALLRNALIGSGAVLAATVALLAYLLLIDAPARANALLGRIAANHAQQQAQHIGHAIAALSERVAAAAASAQSRIAIADGNSEAAARLEDILLGNFPEASGLRVLALNSLGTADLDADDAGLRNHIEVDLVRRVSNDEPARAEAYQADGQWIASLARLAADPAGAEQRAVVLLSVDSEYLRDLLGDPAILPGGATLRQRIYTNGADRNVDIISVGSGLADLAQSAEVAGTHWQVVFSPSAELVASVAGGTRPNYAALIIVAGVALGALIIGRVRTRALLQREAQRIGGAAEQRSAVDIAIPELLPLAQELRRLALRRNRSEPTSTPKPAHQRGEGGTGMGVIEGAAEKDLPADIFRAYDIRGVADRDLEDETVYRIGAAIGTIAGEMGEQTIALGYDGRASSGRIRSLIEKALLRSGRDVVDIGLVPTPLLYFATHRTDARSGIMITGSHNAPEYNGLKIVLRGETLAEGAIDRVRSLAQSGRFSSGTGRMAQRSIVSDYLDEVVSDIAIAVPLKIVVDAGNGATGHIAPSLLEELGCEVLPLNCEVDGSFPGRSPDPGDDTALAGLVEAVKSNRADFGVAYDGDGDRVVVVTGSGRILRTDTLMMLFARDVVTRHPGADVVYDVKCSRDLAQLVTSLGGRPVLSRTGHALMKQKMAETGALLGGEFSGHIFFGERWYGFDDGMYATGRLAEILSSQDLTLDDFIDDLPSSLSTPEILIPIDDDKKFALMERFKAEASFPGGKSNKLDGLRVDFPDGWGLLRASNTGPALTARFEARDQETLDKIRSQFREQLEAVDPDLAISL